MEKVGGSRADIITESNLLGIASRKKFRIILAKTMSQREVPAMGLGLVAV